MFGKKPIRVVPKTVNPKLKKFASVSPQPPRMSFYGAPYIGYGAEDDNGNGNGENGNGNGENGNGNRENGNGNGNDTEDAKTELELLFAKLKSVGVTAVIIALIIGTASGVGIGAWWQKRKRQKRARLEHDIKESVREKIGD